MKSKNQNILLLMLFALIPIFFESCFATFYGRFPNEFKKDQIQTTIFFTALTDSLKIENRIKRKIEETLISSPYHTYSIIYKSNKDFSLGRRIYYIKLHKSDSAKLSYLQNSKDSLKKFFKATIADSLFDDRFNNLKTYISLDKVYSALPELRLIYPKQYFNPKELKNDFSKLDIARINDEIFENIIKKSNSIFSDLSYTLLIYQNLVFVFNYNNKLIHKFKI